MSLETILSSPINAAIIGGALIGLASGGYYLLSGRISGLSGIYADSVLARPKIWRFAFIFGLVFAGWVANKIGAFDAITIIDNFPLLLISGLLVGFGTRLGNGCTSGHGVCGISRLSVRSFIAVGVFMACAIATVFIAKWFF